MFNRFILLFTSKLLAQRRPTLTMNVVGDKGEKLFGGVVRGLCPRALFRAGLSDSLTHPTVV